MVPRQALQAAIDRQEAQELLYDLIRIESHSDANGQEAAVAQFIAQWLEIRGIPSKLEEVLPGRYNLLANIGGSGKGESLLFNGHLDTVPPYSMPNAFQPRIEGGKLYGRGSVDMKGAIAAMLAAMAAIKRSGIELAGEVWFAGTVGEETYSPGAAHLVDSGFRADYAIVGEPTSLNVGVAHKGVAWYIAEFSGLAAHGSVPEAGINAIYQAARWVHHIETAYLAKLKQISHPLLGHPTLNIGMIEGGTRPVIVPASCTVTFERRLIPGESAESALAELQQTLDEASQGAPAFKGNVSIMNNFQGVPHGPLQSRPDGKLPMVLASAYSEAFGVQAPEPAGLQFWTDAALLQMMCRETVVCGPGDIAQAHSDNEFVELAQFEAAISIYAQAALAICEHPIDRNSEADPHAL